MQIKKMPTTRGSMAGALTKHLDRHFTPNQLKNQPVHRHAGFCDSHEFNTGTRNLGAPTGPGERGLNFQGTCHQHAGIIRAKAKAPVHSNTLKSAVHFPTVSGILLCPEFSNAAQCRVRGCGLGAMVRKAIGVTDFTFETPSPPDARSNAEGGFSIQSGTETMKSTTTPTSGTSTSPDHHQAALVLRATTHLSEALYQLRQAEDHEGIRKATGRAISAARYLKQLAGGAHHV